MSRARLLGTAALVWIVGFAALRVSLLAPETCLALSPTRAVAGAEAAAEWIAAGQSDSGRYLYEYDRGADEDRPGYNIVRHAGVTMSLYQLAAVTGDESVLEVADRGLEFMVERLEPAGDGEALTDLGVPTAKLGASALMTASLVARRDATGEARYDAELRALGRFMAGQVGATGRTSATYDLDRQVPLDEVSRYSTGEAGWALAQLGTLFPDEGWDEPARRVLHYLATERDEAEDIDFRPWPDQWAAYLLGELAPRGLSPAEVTYARALAAQFGTLIRSESQKDGYPPLPVDVRARGAGLGVWVEGLGSLARAAAADDRLADLRPLIEERLACGAGIVADRQVTAEEAEGYADPGLVRGAWFRDDLTRMDDQQHALSGLLAAAETKDGSTR